MNPLDAAIAKATAEQYPPSQEVSPGKTILIKSEKKSRNSRWSDHFKLQLKSCGFIIYEADHPSRLVMANDPRSVFCEHKFHPTRLWRMDFAIMKTKIHVEIEGGIWMKGGSHSLPSNIQRDIEKQNAAVMLGWHPIRLSPKEIKDGTGIYMVADFNTRLLSSKTM